MQLLLTELEVWTLNELLKMPVDKGLKARIGEIGEARLHSIHKVVQDEMNNSPLLRKLKDNI